jgi:DNA helicase HerA-like ATPase
MNSLVQSLADRVVGTVEEVSADKIVVLLDHDAPQATALNTGFPEGFPRINGYLLIPNEVGATIGWITSVRIERLPYPKRMGMQDFGLIDLPFPCRMVVLTPLGTLVHNSDAADGDRELKVNRGVDVFPSVGDPVLLPTRDQLQVIVEGESGETRRILLGHCPTAGGAAVYADPDKLFGRHLAILGNTGAGKSCSVAGIIRWSIEAAQAKLPAEGSVNARFIILDPNGEYARAFSDLDVRLFQVEPVQDDKANSLKVPAWLWNGEEWAAFTGAAPGVQRPILFDALRRLRSGLPESGSFETKARNMIKVYLGLMRLGHSSREYLRFPGCRNTAVQLRSATDDFNSLMESGICEKEDVRAALDDVRSMLQSAVSVAEGSLPYYNPIPVDEIIGVIDSLEKAGNAIGLSEEWCISEDTPAPFDIETLPRWVEALASSSTRDLSQFVDSLNLRIRSLITRGSLAPILNPCDSSFIKLEEWLGEHIGKENASNGQIVVVDLSLVPSEVIHVVIAVLARLTFEALQRYRRENKKELPTVLVLEEAHTFVHRQLTGEEATHAARACSNVFERIAREGRKFGLGLVLASQRPSELSQTVLSQCNTFLLHRIVNDRDQELVKKLVPDGLGALLRELPSLPSRRAVILGWASPAPVMVEIRPLPDSQRPHSPDPHFWDVWTRNGKDGERLIDWSVISHKWAGNVGDEAEGMVPWDEMGLSDDNVEDSESEEEEPLFDEDLPDEEPPFDHDLDDGPPF